MSKDSVSRTEVEDFIWMYFNHELDPEEPEIVERKGYTAFKRNVRAGAVEGLTVSQEQMQALYNLATGESATYVRNAQHSSPRPAYVTKALERITQSAYEVLTERPTSVTDLCKQVRSKVLADDYATLRRHYCYGADYYAAIRDCFREMGKRGLVGMHEINTCGRCHIRVYYRI